MRLLREPLVHFSGLALLLFAVHAVVAPEERTVVVSLEVTDSLAAAFADTHGRAPTEDEEEALVAKWVTEEILYREAMALGIDEGDPVVRERLAQKMTFVLEDRAGVREGEDEARRKEAVSSAVQELRAKYTVVRP